MDGSESTVEFRKCKRCNSEKPLNVKNFAPRKFKDTHYFDGVCRTCWNSYRKKWMQANRDRYSAKEAAWYERNRERLLSAARVAYRADPKPYAERASRRRINATPEQKALTNKRARALYKKNHEKIRAYAREWQREWRKKNPEQSRLNAKKAKAKRRGAHAETVTKKQIENLFAKQRGRCAICRKKIHLATKHIDHIKAISKGGKHEIKNLQLTCPSCNMTKQNKDPIDFMQNRGFLL